MLTNPTFMQPLSDYDISVFKAIITDPFANVTEILNLKNVYSALFDADYYPTIKKLLVENKLCELPNANFQQGGFFREYLEVYSFENQDQQKHYATLYDSDELFQDPQIIDIIPVWVTLKQ